MNVECVVFPVSGLDHLNHFSTVDLSQHSVCSQQAMPSMFSSMDSILVIYGCVNQLIKLINSTLIREKLSNPVSILGSAFGTREDRRLTFRGPVNLRHGANKIALLSVAVGLPVSSHPIPELHA